VPKHSNKLITNQYFIKAWLKQMPNLAKINDKFGSKKGTVSLKQIKGIVWLKEILNSAIKKKTNI
jgi:hypothetical protein